MLRLLGFTPPLPPLASLVVALQAHTDHVVVAPLAWALGPDASYIMVATHSVLPLSTTPTVPLARIGAVFAHR